MPSFAVVVAVAALAVPMTADGATGRPVARACAEDAPCWNWATMGNHKRAIVTIGGRKLVVGPIRYGRLNRAFRIDWARSARLRGDGHRYDVQSY